MRFPKIRHVRAFTARGAGADYHDQQGAHWIDDHIATPMSRYPEYRQSRRSFGINVLGTLVVEIEAEDGTIGFAVTTGGEPACFIVEKHLARFLEGRSPVEVEKIWDQMYFATQFYGRKGLVVNAISGVDLALWDLLCKLRGEPVHHLLGGALRDELRFYATGARPDIAKELGFVGGKLPLHHGTAEGNAGMDRNIALLADMRGRCGDDFWLIILTFGLHQRRGSHWHIAVVATGRETASERTAPVRRRAAVRPLIQAGAGHVQGAASPHAWGLP